MPGCLRQTLGGVVGVGGVADVVGVGGVVGVVDVGVVVGVAGVGAENVSLGRRASTRLVKYVNVLCFMQSYQSRV